MSGTSCSVASGNGVPEQSPAPGTPMFGRGVGDRREQVKQELQRFRSDLAYHAQRCLRIRTKAGTMVNLEFNTAQIYLHGRLQAQLADKGRVRALVLKGRQQGVSTYTSARYYSRASLHKGVSVFILTHEQSATDTLFDMVDRLHTNNPFRPHTGAANAKELEFDKLGSSYTVATAGQKAGGRGKATTLYHGSEVAFWANASDHFAASVQTVPDIEGTEIILESTANGPSGEFYERSLDAQARRSDYELVFIPWFWQAEYQKRVPEGFEISNENLEDDISEREYMEMFGLTLEQMVWRRDKINELRSHKLFNQEYPATPQMAFTESKYSSYIPASDVLRARKRKATKGEGPLLFGVDPAGAGGDRFAIAARRGHVVEWVRYRNKITANEAFIWLQDLVARYGPDKIFVDGGGIGQGLISLIRTHPRLHLLTSAVDFGGKSQHKIARPKAPGPKNRRAEMYERLKDWLALDEGVSIPDIDMLHADLTAARLKPTLTNDILLESKEEMRSRGVRSPDLADAIALTFASLTPVPYKAKGRGLPNLAAPGEFYTDEYAADDDSGSWMGI